jgi:fucose permease
MTLGLDALETGLRIFPLSISLILFSALGTRLSAVWAPRGIVRLGQLILIASGLVLLASVSLDLRSILFAIGMFLAGAALGLLASQLGNVTMSSVSKEQTSEVGGLQGVFQNLGSSLGTALIGTVLISSLATSFLGAVQASDLSAAVRSEVVTSTQSGVTIVAVTEVDAIAERAGLSDDDAQTLSQLYAQSQISSLRVSIVAIILLGLLSLPFSRHIPAELVGTPSTARRGRK